MLALAAGEARGGRVPRTGGRASAAKEPASHSPPFRGAESGLLPGLRLPWRRAAGDPPHPD